MNEQELMTQVRKERRSFIRRRNLWDKLEPSDIIAVVVIAGVIWLNYKGINTMLSMSVGFILTFYFGYKLRGHTNRP